MDSSVVVKMPLLLSSLFSPSSIAMRLSPGQNSFAPRPDQAFHQQQQKDNHGEECAETEVEEGDGEWKEEDDLHIENEEDDAVKIVIGTELNPGITFGFQAAFINSGFIRTGLGRGEEAAPEIG